MQTDVAMLWSPDGAARVTLVLGGGYKLGGAFHAGVILALDDEWGLDARQVDSIIATSSGAIAAGLLAAGMSPQDVFRRETNDELSTSGQTVLARTYQPDRPSDQVAERVRLADLRGPWCHHRGVPTARAVLAALLPRGMQSMAPLEQYFDALIGKDWPTQTNMQFCAVDLGSGERVALTRESGATLGRSVAASCSIPGISRPVRIEDRDYVDGAIYSINSVDLASPNQSDQVEDRPGALASHKPKKHTVIISAPLSANQFQMNLSPMSLLRNTMRLQTAGEVRKLTNVDQVVLVEPTNNDIAVMGANLNADHRRGVVAHNAHATASNVFRDALVAP